MNDKTIAEIIGWRKDGGDTQYLPFYVKSDGTYGHGEPDCDDMLAWLDKQGHACEMSLIQGGGVDLVLDRCAGYTFDTEAPTLHAALEAAVRAVHDTEEAK